MAINRLRDGLLTQVRGRVNAKAAGLATGGFSLAANERQARTRTFCRMTLEIVSELPRGESVAMTSTRSSGWMNPATPTTSSTRTASPRIPSGISAASPRPASLAASFAT